MKVVLFMESLMTCAPVQTFVCALKWLRNEIHNFKWLIESLHRFLENVYVLSGKKTKGTISLVKLSYYDWGQTESRDFDAFIHSIPKTQDDSLIEKIQSNCASTGILISCSGWELLQIPYEDIAKPHEERHHDQNGFRTANEVSIFSKKKLLRPWIRQIAFNGSWILWME